MAQSSFYGGRQGASFVIVERFDGINIPQPQDPEDIANRVYRTDYLAVTNDKEFYIYDDGFIYRNSDNYTDYVWKRTKLNGTKVNTKTNKEGTGATSEHNLDVVLARGMVQCFSQGGATTDIVNYGEYVIIDTPSKENPDNGKVFRRGMNYQISEDNSLAGAEYIGQIVGPQGEAPELDIDKYDDIIEIEGHAEGAYTVSDDDLVPGKYEEEDISYRAIVPEEGSNPHDLGLYELVDDNYVITADTTVQEGKTYYTQVITPIPAYNDDIDYAYSLVRDEFGNTTGCKIGFKIPYLIEEFYTESRPPYYTNADAAAGKCDPEDVGNPLPADFNLIEQLAEEHPFYDKWKINIPKGIKGNSFENLELCPTKARAGEDIYDTYIWDPEPEKIGTTTGDELIVEYDPTQNYFKLANNAGYLKKLDDSWKSQDGWGQVVKYKEIDYDNKADGVVTERILGEYNDITDIELDATRSELTIYYTNKQPSTFTIKCPTDVKINTKDPRSTDEGSGSQKVAIHYSTDNEGVYTEIGEPLNYIVDTYVVPVHMTEEMPAIWREYLGHLMVYYSDPRRRASGITNTTFPSRQLGKDVTGWVDEGSISSKVDFPLILTEGITISGDFHQFNCLDYADPSDPQPNEYPVNAYIVDSHGDPAPPEIYTGHEEGGTFIPNYNYAGWSVIYRIGSVQYASYYDYSAEKWMEGVTYGQGLQFPAEVIGYDKATLKVGGFEIDHTEDSNIITPADYLS